MKNKNVLVFGEVLLRYTPPENLRIKNMDLLKVSLGGAESNVAIALSHLGHSTKLLSAVPDNSLGDRVLSELASNFVNTESVHRLGDRMGSYFYESGVGMRPSNVIYDRKNSSIHNLVEDDCYDIEKELEEAHVIHVSGITCALSKKTDDYVYALVKKAKSMGIKVSFDFNFRNKLWSFKNARESYLRILPYIDYCFAGFNDFSAIINNKSIESEEFSEGKLLEFYQKYHELYGIECFASTKRDVLSVTSNKLQGFLYKDNKLYKTASTQFDIEERIGAGDAFAAGILHGILKRWKAEDVISFGTALGLLKHSLRGDYSTYSELDVSESMKTITSGVRR